MDYRSAILAVIDSLQHYPVLVDAWAIHQRTPLTRGVTWRTTARELREMAKAGIVVYDRKASGWRRA
jgi:hypothetical protein